jgi:hypothetical protein
MGTQQTRELLIVWNAGSDVTDWYPRRRGKWKAHGFPAFPCASLAGDPRLPRMWMDFSGLATSLQPLMKIYEIGWIIEVSHLSPSSAKVCIFYVISCISLARNLGVVPEFPPKFAIQSKPEFGQPRGLVYTLPKSWWLHTSFLCFSCFISSVVGSQFL